MRQRRRLVIRRVSLRGVLSAAGAVGIASVARADAPGGPGGQYGTFDLSNVVIFDRFTGLTWQRAAVSSKMPWNQAAAYCAALSLGSMASGWRLPSYKELLTLEDDSPHVEYEGIANVNKFIDSHAFGLSLGNVELTPVDAPYWSSSPYPGNGGYIYVVDFGSGDGSTLPAGVSTNFRCVHD
jgi:hypothetical protein